MKNRIILLAGAAGVGLGALTLIDGPERPSKGLVVVAASAISPEQQPQALAPSGSTPMPSPAQATVQTEDAASAELSSAPANYTYWEGGDPGVWGTPAEFSKTP